MASHDFGILLGLAYQGFVDHLHAHLAGRGFSDLAPTTGYVVRALAASPRITQRELATRLGLTEQRTGQIVEDLVEGKLVVRLVDPDDARAKRLDLGVRGRELLRVARAAHARFEKALERELGEEVVATVRRTLEHIVSESADETAAGRLRAT